MIIICDDEQIGKLHGANNATGVLHVPHNTGHDQL
jgi:hypothetical protein